MTKGDGPSVHIGDLHVKTKFLDHCEELGGRTLRLPAKDEEMVYRVMILEKSSFRTSSKFSGKLDKRVTQILQGKAQVQGLKELRYAEGP